MRNQATPKATAELEYRGNVTNNTKYHCLSKQEHMLHSSLIDA